MRSPLLRSRSSHVNDWKHRVDLPGSLGDLPAVHSALQVYVRNERSIRHGTFFDKGSAPEQRHSLLAGSRNSCLKAALDQGVLNQALNLLIVFDDQNDWQLDHTLPPESSMRERRDCTIVPHKAKSEHFPGQTRPAVVGSQRRRSARVTTALGSMLRQSDPHRLRYVWPISFRQNAATSCTRSRPFQPR